MPFVIFIHILLHLEECEALLPFLPHSWYVSAQLTLGPVHVPLHLAQGLAQCKGQGALEFSKAPCLLK